MPDLEIRLPRVKGEPDGIGRGRAAGRVRVFAGDLDHRAHRAGLDQLHVSPQARDVEVAARPGPAIGFSIYQVDEAPRGRRSQRFVGLVFAVLIHVDRERLEESLRVAGHGRAQGARVDGDALRGHSRSDAVVRRRLMRGASESVGAG